MNRAAARPIAMAPTTKQKLAPACRAVSTLPWLSMTMVWKANRPGVMMMMLGTVTRDARLVQARLHQRGQQADQQGAQESRGRQRHAEIVQRKTQLVAEQRQDADGQHDARRSCCRATAKPKPPAKQARQRAQGQREGLHAGRRRGGHGGGKAGDGGHRGQADGGRQQDHGP